LNSKEWVLTILNHKEADRTPLTNRFTPEIASQLAGILGMDYYGIRRKSCSLKRKSKAKALRIPYRRITSKLKQSTRLTLRLDAANRALIHASWISSVIHRVSITGRTSW